MIRRTRLVDDIISLQNHTLPNSRRTEVLQRIVDKGLSHSLGPDVSYMVNSAVADGSVLNTYIDPYAWPKRKRKFADKVQRKIESATA